MIPDAKRSILRRAALLAVLGLGFWASPAAAQLAPWQQPPGSGRANGPHPNPLPEGEGTEGHHPNSFPEGGGTSNLPDQAPSDDETDHSPVPSESEDYEQVGTALGFRPGYLADSTYQSLHDRFWARSEFLGWWTKGFATPPLLTTSPAGTPAGQAGVLDAAGTSVLLGGKDLSGGLRPGERFALGTWLTRCQNWGMEASYLQINRQTDFFNASGISTPILARPFINTGTGAQDAQILNYPGLQSGQFSSAAASELQVAEFLVRKNLGRRTGLDVDLVAGYRYQQLDDHLAIDDSLTFSSTQSGFPTGSMVQQSDRFDTRNVFQGGVVGMSASLQRPGWTLDTVLKIAVGQTSSRVAIDGSTNTTIPGQAATLAPGGLLALPSNMGVYNSGQFSVVPELGVTLGFDLSPQLRATIGYDLLYWESVARPGDQIDVNLDPRQFPPPSITNATRPEFTLHTSDYWAQGVNLGLGLRF